MADVNSGGKTHLTHIARINRRVSVSARMTKNIIYISHGDATTPFRQYRTRAYSNVIYRASLAATYDGTQTRMALWDTLGEERNISPRGSAERLMWQQQSVA